MNIKKTTLNNGLDIILINNRFSESFSFQLWVKAGSRNEKSGKTGLSHMLEHMMFKGSKNYGPQKHAQIIQANGGELNAFTSNDKTVFYDNMSTDKLEIAIKLEADRFINLSLNEKEFLPEREVVYEERRLRTDNSPYGKAIEMLFALSFIAHPYHWPVIGWSSDIENWSIDDIRDYYKKWYTPKNVFIVLSGKFDENKALNLIEKYFGKWDKGKVSELRTSKEPEQKGERISLINMDVKIPFVFASYKVPEYSSEDSPVLDIIERILSGGESSRIYKELVYKERLALSAGGGVYSFKDYGMFFTYGLQNKEKNITVLKDKLLNLIEDLKNNKIDNLEIEKAKNQLKAEIIGKTEKNFSMGMLVGESYFYTGELEYYKKLLEKYSMITESEIKDVLGKYFSKDKRNIVMILPKEEK
jgi:zinc protease